MYKLINNGGVIATQAAPIEYIDAQYAWQTEGMLYADTDKVMTVEFIGPPESRKITRLAFRNRFTSAEKVGLEIAQLDDPAATMQARAQAAALRSSQADLSAATFVDLDRPDTRAGVQMLEAAGLLSPGRALEILDAPVTPLERPQ